MLPNSGELAKLVIEVAEQELLPRFTRSERRTKADGSVVTEADYAVNNRLREIFDRRWGDIPFFSEEIAEAEQRFLITSKPATLWCLDPVDGSSNFASGLPFFSISLALLVDGAPALGVVYDPCRRECFRAERGRGAWLNDVPLRAPKLHTDLRSVTAILDFKQFEPSVQGRLVTENPCASLRDFGSSALEWCWMALGRGQVYLHGGQRIWDLAAGSLVLREAGGFSSTLHGDEVFRFSLAPRSVVASPDEGLFQAWRLWLATLIPSQVVTV